MIKKGLALEAAGLREDELELEVPSYFITGRLGGAHPLQRSLGEPSPRGSNGSLGGLSAEALCCPFRPDVLAASGCVLAVSLDAPGGAPGSRALVFGPLPLPRAAPPDLLRAESVSAAAFAEIWK